MEIDIRASGINSAGESFVHRMAENIQKSATGVKIIKNMRIYQFLSRIYHRIICRNLL